VKILHITFHRGCELNLNYVAQQLGHEITTQYPDWGYNIGHARAETIWNKYRDYYNQFDLIITSDTAPLSRILMQNNYSGKLIIWVCNRFDYCDMATNDCRFPDQEYYDIFRASINKPNVKIFSYTKFEHEYAAKYRNVIWSGDIIKPCSFHEPSVKPSAFPSNIIKSETFLIPPYHNDTLLLNLKSKCDSLGIQTYGGRYNGPSDLKDIKGIIHIPYAWSNLALFENWSLGNVYFIPTKRFLIELSNLGNFFWSPPFPHEFIESSEWYLPEHKDLFIYFDNWNHLKTLVSDSTLLANKRQQTLQFSNTHTLLMLGKWREAFDKWSGQ
jgi:hypothetical protein